MIKNLFAAFTAFSDIDGSDYEWAGEAIEKVAELGIINGDSDGSFRPGDGVKKIEALLMLSRVTGSSIENYEPFVRFAEYQYSDTLDECGLADSEYRGEIAFLLYKDVLSESELIDYMDNPDAVLKVGEATRLIAELSSDPDLTNNVKTSRAPT